jgi:hypothetical protein
MEWTHERRADVTDLVWDGATKSAAGLNSHLNGRVPRQPSRASRRAATVFIDRISACRPACWSSRARRRIIAKASSELSLIRFKNSLVESAHTVAFEVAGSGTLQHQRRPGFLISHQHRRG